MVNIDKDVFCKIIRDIENYENVLSEINDIYTKYSDGYFSFHPADTLIYDDLIELLNKLTNSSINEDWGSDIEYYLFEPSRKIWVNDKEYDIRTPEKLYDFLVLQDKGLE